MLGGGDDEVLEEASATMAEKSMAAEAVVRRFVMSHDSFAHVTQGASSILNPT